jgi:hypothetical protein
VNHFIRRVAAGLRAHSATVASACAAGMQPGRIYAVSAAAADDGGPRTRSSLSTGHRQAMKSYSPGSSRLSQPSRSLRAGAGRPCQARARDPR